MINIANLSTNILNKLISDLTEGPSCNEFVKTTPYYVESVLYDSIFRK